LNSKLIHQLTNSPIHQLTNGYFPKRLFGILAATSCIVSTTSAAWKSMPMLAS